MTEWKYLINEQTLASALPGEYESFAKPVADALSVFLNGLSPLRQREILKAQASLAATASTPERLVSLAQSCPVLHKLGQILARDQRISLDFRRQLQQLESLPPSVSMEHVRNLLSAELPSVDRLGLSLQSPPIAEASVAVVVGFTERGPRGRKGVFKVLKPGIHEKLHEELDLLQHVGEHLDQRCQELGIPTLDYQDTFNRVRDRLRWEVRLDREQRHLKQAREFYADQASVTIPEVFEEYCTPGVTAMQWIDGEKITDHGLERCRDRRRLAKSVIEALIARCVFSTDPHALFHCDPHAGNLLFTSDTKIAILDWSLACSLEESHRVAIVQILLGAVTLHSKQIVDVLSAMSERPPNQQALRCVVDAWLRRIRHGQLPGMRWLVGLIDQAVQEANLRLSSELILFRKTLYTLDGLLTDLANGDSPDQEAKKLQSAEMDRVLIEAFLKQFLMEWPKRWITHPYSRKFATRLSNLDLTCWMLLTPNTTARLLTGQIRDLMQSVKQCTGVQKYLLPRTMRSVI